MNASLRVASRTSGARWQESLCRTINALRSLAAWCHSAQAVQCWVRSRELLAQSVPGSRDADAQQCSRPRAFVRCQQAKSYKS